MRTAKKPWNVLLGSSAVAALLGCAGAPAPTVAPPALPAKPTAAEPAAKEPIETGSTCVKAESQCDGGECVLTIKNGCDQAASCDAAMTTTCKSPVGEMVEAARRKRQTFAAKTDGEIRLVGDCQGGEILRTAMKSIVCK
ncbi:MAG: hypothetical protein ABJE95_25610 [Byssovorax sp.]